MWLAHFALANALEHDPAPRFFGALKVSLARLAEAAVQGAPAADVQSACLVGSCISFLDEHGLLPDYKDDATRHHHRELLLQMGSGTRGIPQLQSADWPRLIKWTLALLRYSECRIPEELPELVRG
jgi:hypothetical protein